MRAEYQFYMAFVGVPIIVTLMLLAPFVVVCLREIWRNG